MIEAIFSGPFSINHLILLSAILVVIIYIRREIRRTAWKNREGMPPELRDAKLVISEKHIATTTPVPLHGKPDQIYRLAKTRKLVPVDTKSGAGRIYLTQVIQLSVYMVILEGKGHQVERYGYIRLITDSGVRYQKIDLWSTDSIIELWDKRKKIVCKQIQANKTSNPKRCNNCDYRAHCH